MSERLNTTWQDDWERPKHYKRDQRHDDEFEDFLGENPHVRVIDPIEGIIEDMAEYQYGKAESESAAANEFRSELQDQGVSYGEWVHLPWRQAVVRYPEAIDHRNLRTSRNRHLVTEAEQEVFNDAKVAVFGLSVGSNILDQLAQSGIGNEYTIADYDRLSPTNLNRIRASMADVGLRKTVIAGRKISEVDPYVAQRHLEEGYDDTTDEIIANIRPDVIVEEVDSLEVKAKIRRMAEELKIPVVMVGDIGERSILDVERYDLGDTKPFNGKLSDKDYQKLLNGDMTEEELQKVLVKLNGIRNISPRLIESAGASELGGFPQLGATAAAGAALANSAVRGILLDRGLKSGTYIANPDKTLNLKPTHSKREAFKVYKDFLTKKKK